MIAVIQRVSKASVTINNKESREIKKGLVILLGIANQDKHEDISWLCKKIIGLRIFNDDDGKMNLSMNDIDGEILLISQFTLHASTKKGNRPSFINAAKPDTAIPIYKETIQTLSQILKKEIVTGEFGANMQVELINDGPVTIVIDTKNKV